MKVINKKLNEAQKVFNTESKDQKEQHESLIRTMKWQHLKEKNDLVDKHVNNILGKIL